MEWKASKEKGPNFGVDADFTEFGVIPLDQTVAATQASKDEWDETLMLAKEGRIDEISSQKQIQYWSTLQRIADTRFKKAPIKMMNWRRLGEGGKPENLPHKWFYGPTGTGMWYLFL